MLRWFKQLDAQKKFLHREAGLSGKTVENRPPHGSVRIMARFRALVTKRMD
jgi:hypothetical protein